MNTTWCWSIAYKKRKSGRLKWVNTFTQDEAEARKKASAYIAENYQGKGFLEYGWNKTWYIQHQNMMQFIPAVPSKP